MSTPLRVVTSELLNDTSRAPPAGLAERVAQLQAEAKRLAREHIDALTASLDQTRRLAEEIAKGGEAYPPGVRDLARRLGEDSIARAMTLEAIAARS